MVAIGYMSSHLYSATHPLLGLDTPVEHNKSILTATPVELLLEA